MKKIAILLSNELKDVDLFIPVSIWRKAKFIVDLISIEKKNSVILESGVKISCNHTFETVNISQYHVLYIPGGKGLNRFLKENWPVKNNLGSDKLAKAIKDFSANQNKYLLFTFDSAQIYKYYSPLNQIRFAGYDDEFNINKNINEEVIIHNNVISVLGYWQLPQFALSLVGEIGDEKTKNKIELELETANY